MTRRRFIIFAALACTALMLPACSGTLRAKNSRKSLVVDGKTRTYTVHVPPASGSSKPMPLILALHGRLGTGEGQQRLSHLDKVSDAHGFLVAYPDGLDRSWADGRGGSPSDKNGVDDVKFLSQLIDKLAVEYNVDRSRVYATGMSNGGFMSARLACDLSNKIAAVAIVAASISTKLSAACQPAKPVSVLIFQGTDDPLVPFAGGALGHNGERGLVLSHELTLRRWAALDHCVTSPSTQHIADAAGDGTPIDLQAYSDCAGGSEVLGYTVQKGGHTWPGGMQYVPEVVVGKTTRNLDASEVLWDFFSHHTR
jgi:polyhydroxybutyrate depolymerase